MGLFDFVKGIGKKNTAPAEPQAAPATPAEPSAQEIANKLLGLIKSLGLGVEGLSVTYNGSTDTAIIKGQVQSQADKEKIILIVGNVDHVAQVDDHGLMQPQRFSPSSPTNRLFHQPSKQKIRLGLTVNKRKSVIGPIVHLEKLIIGLVKLTHKNPRQPPFES